MVILNLPARKYGFRKDHPNLNRPMYGAILNPDLNVILPRKVDLRDKFQPVFDQGQSSACTAHAAAGIIGYLKPELVASRLFIYYNERVLDGDPNQDNGSALSSAIYVTKNKGICPESLWPYNLNDLFVQPNTQCYQQATKDLLIQDLSIANINEMRHSLANGLPFMFGFQVYSYFESADMAANGILRLPTVYENRLGGHAVCAAGYDDDEQVFIVRNSYGPNWGLNGYFKFPYDYITNPELASDFWAMQNIS